MGKDLVPHNPGVETEVVTNDLVLQRNIGESFPQELDDGAAFYLMGLTDEQRALVKLRMEQGYTLVGRDNRKNPRLKRMAKNEAKYATWLAFGGFITNFHFLMTISFIFYLIAGCAITMYMLSGGTPVVRQLSRPNSLREPWAIMSAHVSKKLKAVTTHEVWIDAQRFPQLDRNLDPAELMKIVNENLVQAQLRGQVEPPEIVNEIVHNIETFLDSMDELARRDRKMVLDTVGEDLTRPAIGQLLASVNSAKMALEGQETMMSLDPKTIEDEKETYTSSQEEGPIHELGN